MDKHGSRAWGGFLVMAFIVLGLCGLFSTYAAQLPYQRELFAENKLDAARGAPDAAARLEALRDTLGDDGAGAFAAQGDLPTRIEAARRVLRRHFGEQGADIALRLRIVLVVFTFGSSLFGLIVVSVLRRTPS